MSLEDQYDAWVRSVTATALPNRTAMPRKTA